MMTDQEVGMIMTMRKKNKTKKLKMKKLNNILDKNDFLKSEELVEKYAVEEIQRNDKRVGPILLDEREKVKKFDDFVKKK